MNAGKIVLGIGVLIALAIIWQNWQELHGQVPGKPTASANGRVGAAVTGPVTP